MFNEWNNLVVTKINVAMFLPSDKTAAVHNGRFSHGLVLSTSDRNADCIFSDGTVIKVPGNSLCYLPDGSNYRVATHSKGEGCWIVDFHTLENLDIKPFSLTPKNHEQFLTLFKKMSEAFYKSNNHSNLTILKNLYEVFLLIKKEYEKKYFPSKKILIIKPALDLIKSTYNEEDLSVENLANLCGISVAYFRRIFTEILGVSPKEYIINRRIEFAKKLILSRQFKINEVAEMCGYAEPCHFSRDFSRRTGTSPSKYLSE